MLQRALQVDHKVIYTRKGAQVVTVCFTTHLGKCAAVLDLGQTEIGMTDFVQFDSF